MATHTLDINPSRTQSQIPAVIERRLLTKVICTLGPASSDPTILRRLIEAGVSIFRLNLSHGSLGDHERRIEDIRAAVAELRRPIALLADLPGPKIRVAEVLPEGVELATGRTVVFQRAAIVGQLIGDAVHLSCTYPHLIDDVEPGQRLLIDDGSVRLLIMTSEEDEIRCTVTQGGVVTSGKGINLPDSNLRTPALTERDWSLIPWIVQHDLDFLAMSFVRSAAEVHELRAGIEREASRQGRTSWGLPIIAKIERPSAVANIEEIVDAANAVMIARGDLGVEMDPSRVPVIQKQIVEIAENHGKPCIVATQMLETMIRNHQPTRAEASDVANAIFDNVDAVMLSGETAVGQYPVLAVETMVRIGHEAERFQAERRRESSAPQKLIESKDALAAVAHGVWTVAHDMDARIIVVWTRSGAGARSLSQNNFHIPILAVSPDPRVLRQMQVLRGVTPLHMAAPQNLEHLTRQVDEHLVEFGWARLGDRCVLVGGWPIGVGDVATGLAIHEVGDH